MFSRQAARSRIPLVRPLRPPNSITRTVPQSRLFTQNTQLLFLAQRTSSRPQLPYLAQPVSRTPGGFLGPNPQLARLISTENRRYVGEQLFLAAKWTAIFWVFAVLGGVAYLGVLIELEERKAPTPSELSFWSRWSLRGARAQLRAGEDGPGSVDWAAAGSLLRRCLAKMDDRAKDGKGVTDVEDGGILIDGIGKAGLDISSKSWQWQASYYEVLMGCATAAEHLNSMVLDKTRSLVFPKDLVIGPSNPDPRPVPAYLHAAPKEADCVPAFEAPETFYMRVLTTRGFTTRQKLDAALSYANWLELKGLHDSAEEMYTWGVDIAKSALGSTAAIDSLIDAKTSVLKVETSPTRATPNILRATTALAIHHARSGNVSSALPILLSVFRARRSAPTTSHNPVRTSSESARQEATTDFAAATNFLTSLFRQSQQPPPPPSGDLPLLRESDKPTCEESELMLYIGEILFATSPASSEGLGWTRQAVTVADANLQTPGMTSGVDAAADRAKCKACIMTGIGNWETMLHRLAAEQSSLTAREGGRASALEWRGWFGRDGGQKGKTLDELHEGVFAEELKQVERLKETVLREGIGQELANSRASGTGGGTGTWIGTRAPRLTSPRSSKLLDSSATLCSSDRGNTDDDDEAESATELPDLLTGPEAKAPVLLPKSAWMSRSRDRSAGYLAFERVGRVAKEMVDGDAVVGVEEVGLGMMAVAAVAAVAVAEEAALCLRRPLRDSSQSTKEMG
ncbi:hypothetical protein LTR29_007579 [Friedmanniomyces endolithicus]|nr:hypothetical protein LTR29_007579 [Friedmanniomyces endolithicus]